jgi:hypothetical protein
VSDSSVVEIVRDGPDWLIVRMAVDAVAPGEALTWFTHAARLNQWWGEEALIEPRPGGIYHVHWASMNWTMRGTIAHCSERTLAYSWTWDHEPQQPARTVIVHCELSETGTIITISHGPYRPEESRRTAEDEDRESHRDGWAFFLPQLHAKMAHAVARERESADEPGVQLGR